MVILDTSPGTDPPAGGRLWIGKLYDMIMVVSNTPVRASMFGQGN